MSSVHDSAKHGQLAPAGAEHVPFAADDVAQVDVGEPLERLLAQGVDVAVDLQVVPAVAQGEEDGLAVLPAGHDPAGHPVVAALGLLPGSSAGVGSVISPRGVRPSKLRAYGSTLAAQPLDLGQPLALPLGQLRSSPSPPSDPRMGRRVHLRHLPYGEDLVVRGPRPGPAR